MLLELAASNGLFRVGGNGHDGSQPTYLLMNLITHPVNHLNALRPLRDLKARQGDALVDKCKPVFRRTLTPLFAVG